MSFIKKVKKFFKKKKVICPRCRGLDVTKDDISYKTNGASYKCNKCKIHFVPYAGYTSKGSGYWSYRKKYLDRKRKINFKKR